MAIPVPQFAAEPLSSAGFGPEFDRYMLSLNSLTPQVSSTSYSDDLLNQLLASQSSMQQAMEQMWLTFLSNSGGSSGGSSPTPTAGQGGDSLGSFANILNAIPDANVRAALLGLDPENMGYAVNLLTGQGAMPSPQQVAGFNVGGNLGDLLLSLANYGAGLPYDPNAFAAMGGGALPANMWNSINQRTGLAPPPETWGSPALWGSTTMGTYPWTNIGYNPNPGSVKNMSRAPVRGPGSSRPKDPGTYNRGK